MYDTDKAKHVARGDHGHDLSSASWHLYRTQGGAFFEAVYDHDGAPEDICPLTNEQARQFLEKNAIDLVEEYFGPMPAPEADTITEVTRRSVIDQLTAGNISWSGRLTDDEFLARLYDLSKLPSHDYRYTNAAGDIYQHCVRNDDWPSDWVFYDDRFRLLHAEDAEFLRFLCETMHPVVQPDSEQVDRLLAIYNEELARDGWVLAEVKKISSKPIFGARKIGSRAVVFEEPTGWQKVDRQLQEMRSRLDSSQSEEQFQVVGLLCRESLISAAQEVYDAGKHFPGDGVRPSPTDGKRMLGGIFDAEFKGNANEEARRHARAAVDLALALQHKRTADFRTAALCAEATCSVVNMLAILAGRRGRFL